MADANKNLPPADALPVDDLRDVPPDVLAMADRTVLRLHQLLDGAPLALVVNAYRAGYAHGRQEAAQAIWERVASYDDSTATDAERDVAHGLRTAADIAAKLTTTEETRMPADDFLGDPAGYEIIVTRLYRDHRGVLVSGTVVVASAVSTRPTLAEAVDELRQAIGPEEADRG